jgi:hypothetical protein
MRRDAPSVLLLMVRRAFSPGLRYDIGMRARFACLCGGIGAALASCRPPSDAPSPPVDASALPPTIAAAAPLPPPPPEPDTPPRCEDARDLRLFVSPRAPIAGVPLHVLVVSDRPMAASLVISHSVKKGDAGAPIAETEARRGETPYFWLADVASPRAGTYLATFTQSPCAPGEGSATRVVNVTREPPPAPDAGTPPSTDELWHSRNAWSHHFEQIYSAWVETLFDAPDDEMPSFNALHEIIRDKSKNFLFDYLGAGEDDDNAPVLRPDCADLPYFLRAYFAFKLGLPFGIGHCVPGGGGVPPSCDPTLVTNEDPLPRRDAGASDTSRFEGFLHMTVADNAHSSSARQPFDEQNSDYYPVPITWDSLRPGTVYADPYGHVLVLAKRLRQTAEHGGVLFAVDAQPDGTVARKRFWRGNFLYATDPQLGGPGFKRFRPILRASSLPPPPKRSSAPAPPPDPDALVRPDDDAVQASPEYADLSRDAAALDVEGFYDRIDSVLSPRPLDPERAMLETIGALEEQVRTRVKSVDNGRKWLETAATPAPMPDGAEIFETTGPWEDFSTPSRDLRILIAIDVVRGFPAGVARRPERYAMPSGASPADVAARLEALLDRELHARKMTYTRTDGSPFELSLAEVVARSAALEAAYDPNDCVEVRWGAPPGSDEAKTCHAQAPEEQRDRMAAYRGYFHDRRRPPRK